MICFCPRAISPFYFWPQHFLFVSLPPTRKYSTDMNTIYLFIRKANEYAPDGPRRLQHVSCSHGDSMGLVWELILFKKAASPGRSVSHSSWVESSLTRSIWRTGQRGAGVFLEWIIVKIIQTSSIARTDFWGFLMAHHKKRSPSPFLHGEVEHKNTVMNY